MSNKRVAVIGAGPSGLAQLRAFKSDKDKGADIPDIVCYEKQEDWGGMWRYTWRTGLDENGEPVHGGMYRYLWSNGPKEGLEFADYTFEDHFGKPIPSYPPRAVLYDYIEGRVKKDADIRRWCRFNSPVRRVTYDEDTGMFQVTAADNNNNGVEHTEEFHHVVVASGHFSTPNVPSFEGFETFNGRVLHAHDFRDAAEFKGKNVLIIGTSYSAEDIGSQCWKYGCKSVTVSHRTNPIGYRWPENWREVPLLEKVKKKTATFKDGTTIDNIDAVILCTGYLHHFPFMADGLKLRTENRLATSDLYKGVVFCDNAKLFYLGMQDQWYTFNMFDAQAWWVRDAIMGRIAVPTDTKVLKDDVKARQDEEGTLKDNHALIRYQGAYTKELIEETDHITFDIDAANEAFFLWKKHKKEGIMTFRDQGGFVSPMTGAISPAHHTPWKDALDDSLEEYLQTENRN